MHKNKKVEIEKEKEIENYKDMNENIEIKDKENVDRKNRNINGETIDSVILFYSRLNKLYLKILWQKFKRGGETRRNYYLEKLESTVHTLHPDLDEVLKYCHLVGCRLNSDLRGSIYQILLNVSSNRSIYSFDQVELEINGYERDILLRQECQDACIKMSNTPGEFARSGMETLLMYFCKQKSIKYSSGLAWIISPFFLLDIPLFAVYECFFKFYSTFFEEQEREMTFHRCEMLRLLLGYHDIYLSQVLDQWFPLWHHSLPKHWITKFFIGTILPSNLLYIFDRLIVYNEHEFINFIVISSFLIEKERILQVQKKEELNTLLICYLNEAFLDKKKLCSILNLATLLYRKTPKSFIKYFTCSFSNPAIDYSFTSDPEENGEEINLNEWTKQSCRTYVGRFYWVNTKTKKTQWEHPLGRKEPPPSFACLPISPEELLSHFLSNKKLQLNTKVKSMELSIKENSISFSNHSTLKPIRFFIIDCRALRSSGDLACGKLPSAYALDPSIFDDPELLEKTRTVFEPLKERVSLCLLGHGVAVPAELVTSKDVKSAIRDAVRSDATAINNCALFLQKLGFLHVSYVEGGFAALHSLAIKSKLVLSEEFIGHSEYSCKYCQFNTILEEGGDPFIDGGDATTGQRTTPSPIMIRRKTNSCLSTSLSSMKASIPRPFGMNKVRNWYKNNNINSTKEVCQEEYSKDNQKEDKKDIFNDNQLIDEKCSFRGSFTIEDQEDQEEILVSLPYCP